MIWDSSGDIRYTVLVICLVYAGNGLFWFNQNKYTVSLGHNFGTFYARKLKFWYASYPDINLKLCARVSYP